MRLALAAILLVLCASTIESQENGQAGSSAPTAVEQEHPGTRPEGGLAASSESGPTPFGLRAGLKKEEVGVQLKEIAPFRYKAEKVPKPHSAFEYDVLTITPKAGLCHIKAVGLRDVPTNVYGSELRQEFEKIRNQIAATYGPYETQDGLFPGSIWNESNE